MRKTERIILCCILTLLVAVAVLYAAGSMDSSRPAPVYRVSVILGQSVDNLEKGVNSAALAYNADVHSVRVADGTAEAQTAALDRELQAGADAVILVRCDADALVRWLDGRTAPVPLVSAEALPIRGRGVANISADNQALARLLGQAVLDDGGKGTALLVTQDGSSPPDGREEALRAVLATGGVMLKTATPWDAVSADAPRLLIAADPVVTEQLASTAPAASRLYGFGYDPSLRNACESRRILALAVVSEFDAGYLALQSAVTEIEGGRSADALLSGYLVRGDNLYEPPVSTILFPIE